MLYRSHDPSLLNDVARALYPEVLDNGALDTVLWMDDDTNIALTDGEGSVGLFELETPQVYSGHYFFKKRGAEAKKLAEEMLNEMFVNYGAAVIKGLTPIRNLRAKWLTRQLGFQSLGIVEGYPEDFELFMLNIDTFFELRNRK